MGRIIIIHYHLNPGGVTRIIESQVQALKELNEQWQVVVMTGHCPNRDFFRKLGAELIINEDLNYLDSKADFQYGYQKLKSFFQQTIRKGDILHVHNLNLGKNPVLTCVLAELINKGVPVVNHAHDFAEDRPENYRFLEEVIRSLLGKDAQTVLYPDRPNLKHAVLNSPDRSRLLAYGIREERTCLLPNPVIFKASRMDSSGKELREVIFSKLGIPEGKKLITYPVRVIRRKNIGEYILLCQIFRDQAAWIVTQPPKNPIEIEPYERWKEFCSEEGIPLIFEAGLQVNFEDLLMASDFCFTTSIKEGFGMVYMEPWLIHTPVIGRNLPNITRDLEQSGMLFPLLYDSLNIPYEGGFTDFGMLAVKDQMNYIRKLIRNNSLGKELFGYNAFLRNLLNSVDHKLVNRNRETILKEYSLENYGQRLKDIYTELAG